MTTRLKALIVAINISILLWFGLIGGAFWMLSDGEILDRQITASISSCR